MYDDHADVVYRVAYRFTGTAADAEDVLQDVFLGLPRALRTYEGRGSLEGWIRRVTIRTALMKVRAAKRKQEVALDAAPEPVSRTRRAEGCVDGVALEGALRSLPETQRRVFVLKEAEGYAHHEIGEMLGMRAGTSKVHLHRAKKALRALLAT